METGRIMVELLHVTSEKIGKNSIFFVTFLIWIKFTQTLSGFQKDGSHDLKVQHILYKI